MISNAKSPRSPRWRTTAIIGVAMLLVGVGITTALTPSASESAHNMASWPLPNTLSATGRQVATKMSNTHLPNILPPLFLQRKIIDSLQNKMGGVFEQRYGVHIDSTTIAGVPVRIIYPKGMKQLGAGPILLNLHGGGFQLDSGSLTETIPIAARAGIPVVAVLYRLAPEHPYPAALNDALAVYSALLEDRAPSKMAVFGTSAGAVLSGELIAKLIALDRPLPAAVGYFSGSADLSTSGDSESWQPLPGGVKTMADGISSYIGTTPVTDPILSPLHGDLSKFPPTLLVSSSRDMLLSSTSIMARALLERGVDARYVVFDGLPHAFWAYMDIPETAQADALMAQFLKSKVSIQAEIP